MGCSKNLVDSEKLMTLLSRLDIIAPTMLSASRVKLLLSTLAASLRTQSRRALTPFSNSFRLRKRAR